MPGSVRFVPGFADHDGHHVTGRLVGLIVLDLIRNLAEFLPSFPALGRCGRTCSAWIRPAASCHDSGCYGPALYPPDFGRPGQKGALLWIRARRLPHGWYATPDYAGHRGWLVVHHPCPPPLLRSSAPTIGPSFASATNDPTKPKGRPGSTHCVDPGRPVIHVRRCPTLPGVYTPSTIGAGELNFRVRNGNGWVPAAIATGQSKYLLVVLFEHCCVVWSCSLSTP